MASLPYPRSPPNSFHRTTLSLLAQVLPRFSQMYTEVSGVEEPPTDAHRCTQMVRQRRVLPRNSQNTQKLLAEKSLPRNSRNSQKFLAEDILPRISQNTQKLLAEKSLPQMHTDG